VVTIQCRYGAKRFHLCCQHGLMVLGSPLYVPALIPVKATSRLSIAPSPPVCVLDSMQMHHNVTRHGFQVRILAVMTYPMIVAIFEHMVTPVRPIIETLPYDPPHGWLVHVQSVTNQLTRLGQV
jgi:hypothetical protein